MIAISRWDEILPDEFSVELSCRRHLLIPLLLGALDLSRFYPQFTLKPGCCRSFRLSYSIFSFKNTKTTTKDLTRFKIGRLFYLGYGRNAWHSTWINRYYPGCVSNSWDHLRFLAEQKRVQGSVFKIETVRSLVLSGSSVTVALVEINERSAIKSKQLCQRIKSNGLDVLDVDHPLNLSENWIIPLAVSSSMMNEKAVDPRYSRSRSVGSTQCLRWTDDPLVTERESSTFDAILDAVTDP